MLEDSKYYLIEAQIDYWKEMIRLNKNRIGSSMLHEMHRNLAQARQELMALGGGRLRLVA